MINNSTISNKFTQITCKQQHTVLQSSE